MTKTNLNIKNEKRKLNKNKSLIQDKPNINYKIENPYLQEKLKKFNNNLTKEKPKEKNLKELYGSKQFQSNTNIYNNTKKILQNKNSSQIGKGIERTSIYTKNKTISVNSNSNINIGNNINIITNNHIQKNLIDNRGILTDFNLPKKTQNEIYNNNINNLNNIINTNNDDNDNERMNRIKEATGNENRRFKGKNSSMEHRYRRFNKEIVMSDGDLMTDEDNVDFRRNHIYSHPYKYKSPNSLYNNTYKYQYNADKENNFLNNNYFYNKDKDFENLDEGGETFYNNFYKLKYIKKSFNNNINNRNKYNSLISYNEPNQYNYTNDIQSKTSNSFYVHKSPINTHNNINNNIITNRDYSNDIDEDENIYTNYMNYVNNKKDKNNKGKNTLKYKGRYHSMIEENDLPLSPYKNYANTNNNYMDNNSNKDEFKSIRRSKNKIRIVKKNNNTSIQEYNLSVGDNDTDNYRNENEYKLINDRDRINNANLHEKTDLKKYFYHFSQNIQPITNNQFNINSINPKNNMPTNNFNTISQKNNIGSSSKKKTDLSNNESNISNSKSTNNLISTPNFSDTGKTPKRPNNFINQNQKINPFNNNESNNENNNNSNSINNSNNEENSQYKIMVKKRPKNDIPVPIGGVKRRNSSSISLNKNLNKIINKNFEICNNDIINYISNIPKEKNDDKKAINKNENENKLIFDNENEMIDYIYNKFEEERKKKSYFNRKLRFTGFVLSKKYKGKNLYDIRIEDDINKINQQLKDEQVLINDKQVEFIFVDEEKNGAKNNIDTNNNDIINKNNELIEENNQLKIEKEKMNRKDMYKNELIKKLDNEKQNFIEEIEKLKDQIEELRKENNKYKLQNNNNEVENYVSFNINKNKSNDEIKMSDEKSENQINMQNKNNNNIIVNLNNNDIINNNYKSDIDNNNILLNQNNNNNNEDNLETKEKNLSENKNNTDKKEKKLAFLLDKIMNKSNNKNEELINDKEEINKEKLILNNLDKENKDNNINNNQALEQKENLEKNNIKDSQISNKE